MSRQEKLFRAIVVVGAAITAPACDQGRPKRAPAPDDAARRDAVATPDATPDAPRDAPADAQVADAGVDAAKAPRDAAVVLIL